MAGIRNISRRVFLRKASAIAAASLAAGPVPDTEAAPSFARLRKFSGAVFINGAPAVENQTLSPGDLVRTSESSLAWLIIRKNAVTMLKERSSLTIGETGRNIRIDLSSGAVLSYVHAASRERPPFAVRTAVAVAGVRGTTFFVKVMNDRKTYICDCFGDVEMTPVSSPAAARSVSARRHTAFFIEATEPDAPPPESASVSPGLSGDTTPLSPGASLFTEAGLIDHTDDEIAEMKRIFRKATGIKPLPEKQEPPPDGSEGVYPI